MGMVSAGAVSSEAGDAVLGFAPFDASYIIQKKTMANPKIVTSAMPISGPLCRLFCFSMFV